MIVDLQIKIAEMDFGNRMVNSRIRNTLQRNAIMTLGQLIECTPDELPEGIGVISRSYINVKLTSMGLTLKSGADS